MIYKHNHSKFDTRTTPCKHKIMVYMVNIIQGLHAYKYLLIRYLKK